MQATPRNIHKNLVSIGQVVSEEKIFERITFKVAKIVEKGQ